ncbi:uncharacterized protein LOC117115753 [Anneissia japonica]|uniref:uncharacterized protein LOC117115753 n=1 Tax=Anneissia japonica TaxID=1529436 RepID=UPI0014258AEE|nr:uncharacterized protein LOC117115753 [Anneissia japonica]
MTVHHNQLILIKIRTDDIRFAEKPIIYKENGDEVAGSYFDEEWTMDNYETYTHYKMWYGRLEHTEAGYFYYKDIDRELMPNITYRRYTWDPYNRIEYFHIHVIGNQL